MKQFLLSLLLCSVAWGQVVPSAPSTPASPSSTVTGQLQTATGGVLTSGTLSFTLSQAAIAVGNSAIVPQVAACYTSLTGNIVGLPDPLVLPVVNTNIGSGTLPAGTYYVKIYYFNVTGQVSAPSPEQPVSLTSQGSIIINPPTLQPSSAVGYGVAISISPGVETIQGTVTGFTQFSQTTPLVAGLAPLTVNNSSCNLWFSDSLVPTGTYYTVNLLNQNGAQVAGYPQTWCTFGGNFGTINVSQGTPTGSCNSNGVFYPTPLFSTPPSGQLSQSVNSGLNVNGNLVVSGSITGNNTNATSVTIGDNQTITGTKTFGGLVINPASLGLAAAVTACGINPCTIEVTSGVGLTANLTAPSNVAWQFDGGAINIAGGVTLTINGPASGPPVQAFAGGTVAFGSLVTQAPVEWFGAVGDWNGSTGTDNTAAIQACVNALTIGACTFQGQSYKISAAIVISKSSVGLIGVGSALFNAALYATVPPSTILISTSSSADIIDVLGGTQSSVIGSTIIKNLNLERTVIPSGTAKGLATLFVQGEMYSNIVSQDSIYDFYFRGTGSVGYGFIENCAAQWGFVGVTEATGNLYGFYIDSTTSVASPSLRIRNSFAVSNISSGPTFYGLAAVGNQLSDLHVNHFETAQNINYGEYLNASNSFILDSFDIHFVDVINDSCVTYCMYATGIGGSINITGGESLCTATCTANYDFESSTNVSIVNHVFYNFGTGDDVLVNNSTNISLLDSTLLGGSNAPIVYNAVSNSHINSVTVTGALASTGITLTGSSNNTIVGDSIFNATTGISLDSASNNNTGLETLQCTSVSGSCVSDSGGSYYGGGVRQFCGPTGSFAPTVSSGFNTGSIGAHTNGTCFFTVTIGTGSAVSTGVIGLASNTNGWICTAQNQSRADVIQQTGSSANSVTLTNFGIAFGATNWTNGDVILVSCGGLH